MNLIFERVALTVCAVALSVTAVNSISARAATRVERFDEIVVKRVRVIDASGKTRLLLSGKPMPEGTIEGRVMPHIFGLRQDAGLMFYNDQGDEQGGLTYSGTAGEQYEGMTFDAWHQDQALEIQHGDGPSGSDSFVAGNKLPTTSMAQTYPEFVREYKALRTDEERRALRARWRSEGKFGRQRWMIGNRQGASDVRLNDANGHIRLLLRVDADGKARIDFLDENGTVTKSITP
ncbi:MAG TPA: hypothetical protein VHS78_19285 [Candidatus Elarobacter sp.]|jgi:hypothetical protein|nr:hypothetical protein [Candidatus Elarobacter sp.]